MDCTSFRMNIHKDERGKMIGSHDSNEYHKFHFQYFPCVISAIRQKQAENWTETQIVMYIIEITR